jgi:hypothetical protein
MHIGNRTSCLFCIVLILAIFFKASTSIIHHKSLINGKESQITHASLLITLLNTQVNNVVERVFVDKGDGQEEPYILRIYNNGGMSEKVAGTALMIGLVKH